MTTPADFWNKLARRYATRPVSDPDGYARTLDATRAALTQDDHVLEIGCGTGSTALALADAAGRITATDYADEMIAIAREKAADGAVSNVEFGVAGVPGGLTGGLTGGARYDAVLAFNLLHLVPDLPGTLTEIGEALRPGGVFVSKTPCLAGSIILRPLVWAMRLVGKAPDVLFLAPDDIVAALRHAGFEIETLAQHNSGTRGTFIIARKRG